MYLFFVLNNSVLIQSSDLDFCLAKPSLTNNNKTDIK